MEELDEAPSTSSKMDQRDGTPEPVDDSDTGMVNIKLPEQLQKITPAEEFVCVRHRWNTNEEIASVLIAFDRHKEWLVLPQKIRPASGSMLLYNRKVVFYRRDGYCWKKRKNGSTIREDHMKLKVQGLECIYGSYVHSAILPTFHRRCYWLLQNPNIVLIHYLNVPYPESAKPPIPSLSYELQQKDWTKEELVDQLRPMLSQVAQGTEHDVEEDQKVEKMLEEILPLLLPAQENNKVPQGLPRGTRPLAPAPVTSVVSSSSSSSTTVSSSPAVKRPARKQFVTMETQPGAKLDSTSFHPQQTQSAGGQVRVTTQHPALLATQLLHSQQQQQPNQGNIPNIHSLTGSNLIQKVNPTTHTILTSSHGQNFHSSHNIPQNLHVAGFVNKNVASSANTPRFLTIGSDVVIASTASSSQAPGTESLSCAVPQLLSSVTPIYTSHGTTAPFINQEIPPIPQSPADNTLIMTTTSPLAVTRDQYLGSQESQTDQNIGVQNPFHQQQQLVYQQVGEQSHSLCVDEHQLKLQQQQQQQQQLQQAPVLTLHLKPSNSSSSDSPGFVLSLQGATIVSHSNEQPPPGFAGFNSSQSLNLPSNQALVFVASQGPGGGLVLNRISSSAQQHHTTPGAPQPQKSFTHHTLENMDSAFTDVPVAMTTAMFTQSDHNENLSQKFTYTSPMTVSSLNHQQQGYSVFSSSGTNASSFPLKVDHQIFSVHSQQFDNNLSEMKKEEQQDNKSSSPTSFGQSSHSNNTTSYSSSFLSNQCQPSFSGALMRGSSEPSTVFSLQQAISQGHQVHSHLPHSIHSPDLMAGPSGLNSSVKDMMTNPNSCDTLDGSFSSLPSADLNLDDLLDLNDLDDVSDLGCSPFTPSDISEQPHISNEMSIEPKGGHVQDSGGLPQSTIAENVPLFTCVNNTLGFHLTNQGLPQPHAPLSPLHPGAPPQSYSPMMLAGPSDPHHLSCDNNQDSDPELNSVIKDFSPDWAYTKTNTKILVAGPWFSENANYSCVFDGEHIPAILLQPGLLRCFTQYHCPGYATLQVARNGVIISNCEVFEFCDKECRDTSTTHPEWFAIDANQLRLLLVERLDQLRRRFINSQSVFQDHISDDPESLEAALVQQVQSLLNQSWTDTNLYPKAGQHNLTLLHLAAGLGFAKLISCLIRWRMDNSCVALEFEVDAQSVDSHACTPLMWACALGKIDAALTLYHWNASPLKMCNKDGLLPLTLARQKGHYNLANQVEQLERAKKDQACQEQPDFHNSTSQNMDVSCSSVGGRPSSERRKNESESKDELNVPPPSFPKPGRPGPKLIRRYSEQVISQQTRTLSKRNSIDILPSGQDIDQATLPSVGSPMGLPVRETTSEPQLPVSPDMAFVAPPAPRLLLEDEIDEPTGYTGEPSMSKMDTDEVVSVRGGSPIIDVERLSSDDEVEANKDGSKHQMVTLANQIIAAIPERIKLSPPKGDDVDDCSSGRGRSESHSSLPSQGSPRPSSFGDDSGISTPMTDSLAFEEYRYPEFGTPASSLSPDSTCLPSPYSPYSFTLDSPPPTTAEFTEYFNAPTTYMEKDFSQLTLSDQEQRKLYEAAKVIQNAYRHYRDKQQQQQQQLQHQKEIEAAILIQSYYRRYKTYAYYKKMSHAAVLIQNQFRSYYAKRKKRGDSGATTRRESERLKKGRNQSVIIQQRFRSHYQRRSLDGKEGSAQPSGEAPDSSPPPPETSSQCPDETQPTDAEGNTECEGSALGGHGTGEEATEDQVALSPGAPSQVRRDGVSSQVRRDGVSSQVRRDGDVNLEKDVEALVKDMVASHGQLDTGDNSSAVKME